MTNIFKSNVLSDELVEKMNLGIIHPEAQIIVPDENGNDVYANLLEYDEEANELQLVRFEDRDELRVVDFAIEMELHPDANIYIWNQAEPGKMNKIHSMGINQTDQVVRFYA